MFANVGAAPRVAAGAMASGAACAARVVAAGAFAALVACFATCAWTPLPDTQVTPWRPQLRQLFLKKRIGRDATQQRACALKELQMWNWKNTALVAWTSVVLGTPVMAQTSAEAPVQVQQAWARASVPGQQATGAFMQLTAQEDLQLVGVETPVAAHGEVHEMRMEGDVMRMRQIDALPLPKGQTVALKPGGYHVMFQQLKTALQEGQQVPVTLVFHNAQGMTLRTTIDVVVQRAAPGMAAHGHGKPAHGQGH